MIRATILTILLVTSQVVSAQCTLEIDTLHKYQGLRMKVTEMVPLAVSEQGDTLYAQMFSNSYFYAMQFKIANYKHCFNSFSTVNVTLENGKEYGFLNYWASDCGPKALHRSIFIDHNYGEELDDSMAERLQMRTLNQMFLSPITKIVIEHVDMTFRFNQMIDPAFVSNYFPCVKHSSKHDMNKGILKHFL